MKKITKPHYTEHAVYYEPFIAKVSTDISVLDQLKEQQTEVLALLKNTELPWLNRPYAPNKWTILDIVQHLIDCERVFVYRAMRFARNDRSPLPFFDENAFAVEARRNNLHPKRLAKEFKTNRQATLAFFSHLSAAVLKREGIASQFTMSVRASVWIIAGHERHHLDVIRERYPLSEK
jgi:hypothetical protein